MNINDIISSGLLELYALGIASPEEKVQVEAWMEEHTEVQVELEQIESSLESYANAYAMKPSASVKKSLMEKIEVDKPLVENYEETSTIEATSEKVHRIPSFMKFAAAALAVLLIGSIILNYSYYNKYQNTANDLQVAQQKISEIDSANLAMNKDLDVITDKNARPVVLSGTPHAPDALAKIFWMKNTGDVYVDPSNLPAVPSGKQYQLWAIVDGKPVDAGMISTESGVYRIQKMKSFGKADAFAITLEKEGGSETPTMEEMYVISKI